MDGVAEPDPDGGDVDGSAPDEVAFVVAGGDGAVLAELADGALDGVALLVQLAVEGGRAAALAAAPEPACLLVGGLGDDGPDAASAQVTILSGLINEYTPPNAPRRRSSPAQILFRQGQHQPNPISSGTGLRQLDPTQPSVNLPRLRMRRPTAA
jgi:hypothetical protein